MDSHQSSEKSPAVLLVVAAVVLAAGAGLLAGTGSSSAGVALGCVAVLCAVVAVNRFTSLTGEVVPVWERVRREIERARRHNGSLVLVRLPLSPATGSVRAVAEQVEFLLRATDYVWVEDRSVLLLLADAERDSAHIAIERVVASLDGRATETPIIAAFPEDELTLGGLVDRLYPPRRVRPMSGRGRGRVQPTPVPAATLPVIAMDEERQASA
jgi:hypothetical protein